MNDLMRIKCGALGDRAQMPTLSYDSSKGCELGYRTDEEALYIGTAKGNVRLCGANDISVLNARLDVLTTRLDSMSTLIDNITARLDAMSK